MKKVFCSAVSFFLLLNIITVAQEFRAGDTITCSYNNVKSQKINFIVSESSTNNDFKKTRSSRTTTSENIFDVRYTGFTSQARAAFEKATEIWSQYLKSDIKVRVLAQWSVSSNINNLGFVIPTEVKDFEGAPLQNVWYPVSLAEKLARKDLNGTGEIDIIANFNSGRSDWYFGLDGNCPANQFDLLTVILHEIGHGLGISGTFFKNGAIGTFGIGGLPKIYDRFIVNGNGQQLITAFQSGTEALGNQLTGNSLEFNSPIAFDFNKPNGVARIFSPNPYNPGSSISHLDQSYNLTNNGLMTPFATPGKVAHNAGPLIKGILYEMGWQHLYINYLPIKDVEDLAQAKINFSLQTDTTYNPQNVKVFYRIGSSGNFTAISANQEQENQFSVDFQGIPFNSIVEYYIETKDLYNRVYTAPIQSGQVYSFFYGEDITPPQLTLKTVKSEINRFEDNILFEATATDNLAINKVELEVYKNNNLVDTYLFTSGANNNFTYNLDLTNLQLQDGDVIQYKVIAYDNSAQQNQRVLPETGLSTINVKVFQTRDDYTNNFNTAGAGTLDFFGDFEIKSFLGFQNPAIHSPHPYPKGTTNNPTILTYNFLYPIEVLAENSFLQFDEVALVKPGTGTDFNQATFGDYVIVEAKKSNEETWINIVNGYNSAAASNWQTYFNASLNNGDSQSQGTLNYFNKRSINLADFFNAGDIVDIRFKLVSRSGNNGWGWAIDNFSVNQLVTSVEAQQYKNELITYPNPFESTLYLNKSLINKLKRIEILSIEGKQVFIIDEEKIDYLKDINLSQLSKGFYIIKAYTKSNRMLIQRITK